MLLFPYYIIAVVIINNILRLNEEAGYQGAGELTDSHTQYVWQTDIKIGITDRQIYRYDRQTDKIGRQTDRKNKYGRRSWGMDRILTFP